MSESNFAWIANVNPGTFSHGAGNYELTPAQRRHHRLGWAWKRGTRAGSCTHLVTGEFPNASARKQREAGVTPTTAPRTGMMIDPKTGEMKLVQIG